MAPPIACSHCGYQIQEQRRGLCRACYAYQYRYGRPRPLTHPTHCVVCTIRLACGGCRALCGACLAAALRRGLRAADVYAGRGIGELRQRRTTARRLRRVQQEAG